MQELSGVHLEWGNGGDTLVIDDPDVVVEREFLVLWPGWEMDNKAWILSDGRVIGTSHGSSVVEWDVETAERKIAELEGSLAGWRRAKEVLTQRGEQG